MPESKPTLAASRRVMLMLTSLSTLYDYLYTMSVSSAYGLLPIFGGALFMSGRVAGIFGRTFVGENRKYLSRRVRVTGTALLGAMLVLCVLLFSLYPVLLTSRAVWVLVVLTLAQSVRASFGRRLTSLVMRGRIGRPAFIGLYLSAQLVPAALFGWTLFNSLPETQAWQTLAGYGLGVLLESCTLWRERRRVAVEREPDDADAETIRRMSEELRGVHSYGAYQRIQTLVLSALQVTVVAAYTLIGATTETFLACMGVSVGCVLLARELTEWALSRIQRRRPGVMQLLLISLFLWLYGLILLYRHVGGGQNPLLVYLSLGLCTTGLTACISCLAELEHSMEDVAEYKLQDHMRGYDRMRAVQTELAIALGQMIALLMLTALCLPFGAEGLTLESLAAGFRPMLVLPPLLLVAGAVLSVLHFPLNNRYFDKLKRFLTLRDEDNPALKKQLDDVVVARHKNRFGVKLIILLLRPLYYHKVLGRENVAGFEDGTMVLVCNHGELYGPVVSNLYVPVSFRPWCISSMMEKDVIVDYLYRNTAVRQKWCPDRLKLPLTRMLCPLFLWIFRSIEAIPVYRDNPRALMKTFRITVEAMQAGDNILVFPETGESDKPGEKGYVSEGVGSLYTGFAMIAPAYWAKTHKRAVFVPLYASKRMRTITIGKGIEYNPEAPATQEKLRIVGELQSRMQAMYEAELAAISAEHTEEEKA